MPSRLISSAENTEKVEFRNSEILINTTATCHLNLLDLLSDSWKHAWLLYYYVAVVVTVVISSDHLAARYLKNVTSLVL